MASKSCHAPTYNIPNCRPGSEQPGMPRVRTLQQLQAQLLVTLHVRILQAQALREVYG